MDYKKIISNQKARLNILNAFNFIPDKTMISLQYWIKTGRKINLDNPKRYTEKLQWYKLNYRHPLMTKCADKFEVRDYVKEKGLDSILNPIYGVYQEVDDIDFNILPNSFAIKHTNGSGRNIFITDKNNMNIENVREKLKEWISNPDTKYGREWCYYNVKSRIIIEKLLDRNEQNDIPDYKFFCFNGKVKYLYTMINYVDNHSNGECSFFTRDFKKLPYRRSEYKGINGDIQKPENFEKMVEVAEILSQDFPHVRVDLYNIQGDIIFGELTFYNASGYTVFHPDDFDFILGNEFKLPKPYK